MDVCELLNAYGADHVKSIPYPQGNAQAEATDKTFFV